MLFGRSAERAHLEQLLDAVSCGAVGCILEGTAGIGKTTVWRDSVESARQRGYQVLETAPSEPESLLAFSGLSDLFERIPQGALDALPDAQAHALKAALLLGELSEASRHQQPLPRAVLGVIRELSVDGPVVIAIDDEQWLDPASARVLTFALCRLRDEPVVALLGRRPEPTGVLSAELQRRFRGQALETISLEPLPMSTIKAVVEARLKRTLSLPLLRRIQQAAEGNPLYAVAIALELEARHTNADRTGDLPMPRTLADAIALRLDHIDPRAHEAMLAIAALSHATLGMLQAAIPDFALSDLESAEQAGVIELSGGRLRFTHPLLASTYYANTPVSKRRELHRRLATVIRDEELRAQHLALGAEAPNRDIADDLERAADVAARRGATESAAQLLEDAARLTPIDHVHASTERIIAAAEHRFTSGEVSRARDMLEETLPDLDAGVLRARARLQLAAIRADEPRVGLALLQAALADIGEDDRWRVAIESELTSVAYDVDGPGAARAHAESAVRAAERLGDPSLLSKAISHLAVNSVCAGEPLSRGALARLSSMEDSPTLTTYRQPTTALGMALYWAGELEAARPVLERAARRALSRGEEWDRLGVLLLLAHLEWESGNQQLAKQHRDASEEALGEFGEAFLWLLQLDALFALETGELTVARAKAEHGLSVAHRAGAVMQTGRMIPLLAHVELLSGKPDLAHGRLQELREYMLSNGFGPAGSAKLTVWSEDVEALIAMGELQEAEEVLAELHCRAKICAVPYAQALAARTEGLLLTARGDLVAAIEAMNTALAAHSRCSRPYEHGRTLLEKGTIERRAKRKAAAKQTLEQALAILEPLDAKHWVERAHDELSRIGLRRARASDGLTSAQTRVAERVAAGLTNPEIADELHMSLRTVESHLSRVFREYGVSSRSQLVAALVTTDGGPRAAPRVHLATDPGLVAAS